MPIRTLYTAPKMAATSLSSSGVGAGDGDERGGRKVRRQFSWERRPSGAWALTEAELAKRGGLPY